MDHVTPCTCADKLDGLKVSGKRKRDDVAGLDDYLQLPDDYATRTSQPGKKRVTVSAPFPSRNKISNVLIIRFILTSTDV